jgi:hypothetical protein
MTKTILVTLVLFQVVEFKIIKVFDTIMKCIKANGLMVVRRPLKREEPPFAGLRVILYLRARTDSAQPIRVVRDSCVKG